MEVVRGAELELEDIAKRSARSDSVTEFRDCTIRCYALIDHWYRRARLRNVSFVGCKFVAGQTVMYSSVDVRRGLMQNVSFDHCLFAFTDRLFFDSCRIEGLSFTGIGRLNMFMRFSQVSNMSIEGCRLRGSNLVSNSFSGLRIADTRFSNSMLTNNTYDDCSIDGVVFEPYSIADDYFPMSAFRGAKGVYVVSVDIFERAEADLRPLFSDPARWQAFMRVRSEREYQSLSLKDLDYVEDEALRQRVYDVLVSHLTPQERAS